MIMVRPSRRTPDDSWMWPCRPSSGWRSSSASRTALLPTGAYCTWPRTACTWRFSSSLGASSSWVPSGGGCRLKMARPGGVPRGGVRVAPADHLVVVVDPEDLVLAVRAPRGAVQQRGQLRRVVVAEHEVERHAP